MESPTPTPTPTTFLHLPDEAITSILSHLSITPTLTTTSLRTCISAFALSTLTPRLLALLRNLVHTIDLLHPHTLPVPAPALPPHLCPSRLPALLTILGPALRAFRLPALSRHDSAHLPAILRTLSLHSPSLRDLRLPDNAFLALPLSDFRPLFSALSTVHITNPSRDTAYALRKFAKHLQHLALLDVCPDAIPEVERLVRKRAATLRSLSLSFDIMAQGHSVIAHVPAGWPVPRFASYIADNVPDRFPNLTTLELSTSPEPVIAHSFFGNQGEQIPYLLDLLARVEIARTSHRSRSKPSPVTHIRVRAIEHSILNCVEPLQSLATEHTEFEVAIPGVSMVLPAASSADVVSGKIQNPSFSVLQLSATVLAAMSHKDVTYRLNVLDLGCAVFVYQLVDEENWRACLASLVSGARDSLNEVRWRFNTSSLDEQRRVCGILADVMELCCNPIKLEVPREVVEVAELNDLDFDRMITSLTRVHTLHLTNFREKTQATDNLLFIRRIVPFLHRLVTSCPMLELVYVEGTASRGVASSAEKKKLIISTLKALHEFEMAHPQTDIGTITGLLGFWLL